MVFPRLRRHCRDERGSLSIEALFWLVLVVSVLAMFVDATSMFTAQARILRIVSDANRAYSVNFLSSTDAVKSYLSYRLGTVAPEVKTDPDTHIQVSLSSDEKTIYTSVTVQGAYFQVFGLFPAFDGLKVTAKAAHMVDPS